MEILASAGSVDVLPAPPTAEQLAQLCASGDYDVVVAQLRDDLGAAILEQAAVRGVSVYAVGVNNVDLDAATRRGIVVANTPDVLTDATADVAMLLMLAAARRAVEADRFLREGRFHGWEPELLLGRDISGATLGLAGFGRIARATARRALGSACGSSTVRGLPAILRHPTRTSVTSRIGSSGCRGRTWWPAATCCRCMCRSRPPRITLSTRPCSLR